MLCQKIRLTLLNSSVAIWFSYFSSYPVEAIQIKPYIRMNNLKSSGIRQVQFISILGIKYSPSQNTLQFIPPMDAKGMDRVKKCGKSLKLMIWPHYCIWGTLFTGSSGQKPLVPCATCKLKLVQRLLLPCTAPMQSCPLLPEFLSNPWREWTNTHVGGEGSTI